MDDVREQLKQLNTEIPPLAAKVETAREAWLSAADRQQKDDLKEVYNDLKEKEKQLLDDRRALQAKLPGAGERKLVSVIISPTFANGHGKAPRDDGSLDCIWCQAVASHVV